MIITLALAVYVLLSLPTFTTAQTANCPIDADVINFEGLPDACDASRSDLCESCVCFLYQIISDAGYDPLNLNLDSCALDNLRVLLDNGATMTAFIRVSACPRDELTCTIEPPAPPAPPTAPPMPSSYLRDAVTEAFGNMSIDETANKFAASNNGAITTGITLSVVVVISVVFGFVYSRKREWQRKELQALYRDSERTKKHPVVLEMRNCTCRTDKHVLLDDFSAKFSSGQIIGILGPSGCGKTTLLNALVHGDKLTSESRVTINGDDLSQEVHQVAFVTQSAPMCAQLTVYESVLLAARLKLPWFMSTVALNAKVNSIIERLGLSHVATKLLGGTESIKQTLSGGELRRTAIAQEMIVDPNVLVLDEPTSGLDSSTSWNLFLQLKNLARDDGKVVIASVHQPSRRVLDVFDEIVVLAKGSPMWIGSPSELDETFTKIDMEPPLGTSTAEWLLEIACDDAKRQMFVLSTAKLQKDRRQSENSPLLHVPAYTMFHADTHSTFSSFCVLMHRAWLVLIRQKRVILSHYLTPAFIALLLGLIGTASRDLEGFQNRMGSIFLQLVYYSLTSMTMIDMITEERSLVQGQIRNNLYGCGTYYFTKLLTDWLLLRIPAVVISSVVFYFMMDFRRVFTAFTTFLGFMLLFNCTQSAISGCCTYTFRTSTMATLCFTCILLISAVFAGYLVNAKLLPTGSKWVTFLSPFFYAWGGILASEMRANDYVFNADFDGSKVEIPVSGHVYLNVIGVEFNHVGRNFIGLSCLCVCACVLGYVVMKINFGRHGNVRRR